LILKLSRGYFLIPGLLLYFLGAEVAHAYGASYQLDVLLLGYLPLGFAHLSVSFSNDYFDREADRSGQSQGFSGGSGVLVSHPELAPLARNIAIGLLVASWLSGALVAVWFALPLAYLVLVLCGSLLGWYYSAPPLKLAYRGLSEAANVLAVGLLIPGLGYYMMRRTIELPFLALTVPLACYGLFFILSVHLPDIESDILAGKRNLLTRFGKRAGGFMALGASMAGAATLTLVLYGTALGDNGRAILIGLASMIPIAATTLWVLKEPGSKEQRGRQTKLDLASVMLFLVAVVLVLYAFP
jgi:1,4-dihydroxy-2-naphthoate octaprenyltransferase